MPGTSPRFFPIWRAAPFLRLVLPLGIGILLGRYIPTGLINWDYALIIAGVLMIVSYLIALRFPYLFGILVFLCWMLAGAWLFGNSRSDLKANFIGKEYQEGALLEATLVSVPTPKANSLRAEASLRQWDSVEKKWQPLSGKVILYFHRDSFPSFIWYSTRLAFKKKLEPIRNTGNPGSFDYRTYAALQDWYYQVYLNKGNYVVLEDKTIRGFRYQALRAREHILGVLRKYIPEGPTLGVAQALLTGYRSEMDREVAEQYAATGVAHIIAISGLHLGMIQESLMLLLLPLSRLRYGKQMRACLIILALWVFAFFSGASPSVLRAAFMFTMILFGTVIGKKGNSYNSLAASAFFLLMFDPSLLFHPGFQLSYSAVLSIFMFAGPISWWVQTRFRWINYAWRFMAVTLAAQVLTLPFVLYYFHQFPVYFILSNLVAVFITWLVLNLLLLLGFIFWWWHLAASILGSCIHGLLLFLNGFIGWVYKLPLSRVEDIYLSLPQALLLAFVICLISAWLLLRHTGSLVWALSGIFVFALFREWNWRQHSLQNLLVVYNIRQQTAVEFIRGHRASFFGDSTCLNDPVLFRTHLAPAHRFFQVKETRMMKWDSSGFNQLLAGRQRVLVLDREPDLRSSGEVQTDLLLIATNLRAKPSQLLSKIKCSQVVADAKLPAFRLAQWQIAADSLHLRFHPVAEKGAFIWDLSKP